MGENSVHCVHNFHCVHPICTQTAPGKEALSSNIEWIHSTIYIITATFNGIVTFPLDQLLGAGQHFVMSVQSYLDE